MTFTIVLITLVVSASAFNRQELQAKLMFNPYLVKHSGQWHRFLTHGFVHAGWLHFGVNMWVLYMFGGAVEEALSQAHGETAGTVLFIAMYIGGVLFSSLPAYGKHGDNIHYNSVGASGAVAAVVFSTIYFLPTTGIGIIFIPVYIPAFVFGPLYLLYEYQMDKRSNDRIAHDAHFWGSLFGFVFSIIMVPGHFTSFIGQISQYVLNILE